MTAFWGTVPDKVTFVTSLINVVAALLLLSACRFVPGMKLTKKLMQRGGYMRFYKFHSYIWWIFVPSLLVHAIVATLHGLNIV